MLGTGIEQIRKEAGASPSSMYHQFPDIDAIMLALLLRIFEELFASLERRVAKAKTAERVIRSLVEGHIDWIAAHPAEGRFMYQAMSMELGRMSEASRTRLVAEKGRMLAPLVLHLGPFVRRKELPRWSPALFDVVVLGAAHEGLRRWLAGAEELAPATLKKQLPKLAWRAIEARS